MSSQTLAKKILAPLFFRQHSLSAKRLSRRPEWGADELNPVVGTITEEGLQPGTGRQWRRHLPLSVGLRDGAEPSGRPARPSSDPGRTLLDSTQMDTGSDCWTFGLWAV